MFTSELQAARVDLLLIPPTANLERQDPECGELEIVTEAVRRLLGTKALVNAFGLGQAASIIVSRP